MDLDKIKTITEELLADLGIEAVEVVVSQEEDFVKVSLAGDDLGILIGRRGETLNAIQRILSLLAQSKLGEWTYISLDAGGYREERLEYLKNMASNAADKARFLAEPVGLPPMSAYERRIIHTTVSEIDDIESKSEGEGYERHVVVAAL